MSGQIERAGWMAKHPLKDEPVEVVTMSWFREMRLERDVLLNAAQTVLINGADRYSLDGLQAAIDSCRPRKSDAEIIAAIKAAVSNQDDAPASVRHDSPSTTEGGK